MALLRVKNQPHIHVFAKFRFTSCRTILVAVYCFITVLFPNNVSGQVDPLVVNDLLQSYRVDNHLQCSKLCWYRKSCVSFAFNDATSAPLVNCVLYTSNGSLGKQLLDGWESEPASPSGVANGCVSQPCGDTEICAPLGNASPLHKCLSRLGKDILQIRQVAGCAIPASIANGLFTTLNNSVGGTATFTCEPTEFLWLPLTSTNVVTCLPTLNWSIPEGQCKQVIFHNPGPPPFIATLPQTIQSGGKMCFKGVFDSNGMMLSFLDVSDSMNRSIMDVALRYSSSLASSTTSTVEADWLPTEGLDLLNILKQLLLGTVQLVPGGTFNLSLLFHNDSLTLQMMDGSPMSLNYDSSNRPAFANASRVVMTNAQLNYVNLVDTCSDSA